MKANANIIRQPETTIAPVLFKSGKRRPIDRKDIVVEVVKKDAGCQLSIFPDSAPVRQGRSSWGCVV